MAAAERRLELRDIQALILDGFKDRPRARYALLEIADPKAARDWLKAAVERVTTAKQRHDASGSRLNIAFTFKGLRELGLKQAYGFVAPFREGMITERRSTVLGDTGESAPENWKWGNGSIHVLLLLYSKKERLEDDWKGLEKDLGWVNKTNVRLIDAYLNPDSKEPFGFVDGISQPYIEGSNTSRRPTGDEARADVIKPGEFILGYLNENDSLPVTPEIDDALDPHEYLRTRPTRGRRDFGRNGTYLVLRQLHQDVTEFLRFLREQAKGDEAEAQRLAAKMVGRWYSGAPLVKAPDADREALAGDNDFGYHDSDPLGHSCPIGAHIRRANPRDSVGDASRATPERALAESRHHRLIRRGRVYGDEATGRGLMFLCLNANIENQFEFVQNSWINSPRFGGLDGETDPLVGPRDATGEGPMTIQSAQGNRRLTGLARFVNVKGGDYFFLPGIRALQCLADLPD